MKNDCKGRMSKMQESRQDSGRKIHVFGPRMSIHHAGPFFSSRICAFCEDDADFYVWIEKSDVHVWVCSSCIRDERMVKGYEPEDGEKEK